MTRAMPACSKASRAAKKSRATHSWARIPCEVFRYVNGACVLESESRTSWVQTNPLDYLRNRVERYRPVRVPGLPPLVAGAIGYFAYDMVRLVERIPDTARDDVGMDDAVMMFFLGLVVFDHVRHRVWIVRNVFTDGEGSLRAKYNQAVREIRSTRRRLDEAVSVRAPQAAQGWSAQGHIEFYPREIPGSRAQIEGIHSRGRYFSGRYQPAVCSEDRRRPV
jgi:anthranilate/para-aminobenzoate synthase component I